MRRLLPALVLAVGLCGGVAAAEEPSKARPEDVKEAKEAKAPDTAHLSDEDREVVENLELLESLDEAKDLDLVEALLQEDEE